MVKIKVKEIKDPKTKVAVNSGLEKIEHIKAQFAAFNAKPEYAEVEVFDMWGSVSETD